MKRKTAFSLVELVVVIVIIAILAAMAIPRLSRGSSGASDSALSGNLAIMRNAINLYAAEHNGEYPGDTAADAVDQLTLYTDKQGNTSTSRDGTYRFGPYLHAVPPCPVGNPDAPTDILIDSTNPTPAVDATNGEGWVYNPTTGQIRANVTDKDVDNNNYSDY